MYIQMQADRELLADFAETRSESAFTELVRRHVNLVYSVATRQVGGDLSLAQDVAQEVFTTLAAKAGRLVDRPSLASWLYVTTQFSASVTVRTERRRRARELEAVMNIDAGGGEQIDWDRSRPLLDQAIAELSDADRDGVCLRFFENRAFAEIGARLGLSENAARMRVERALEKLQRNLERRGITSTSAAVAVALAGQSAVAAPLGLASSIAVAAIGTTAVGSAAGVFSVMSLTKVSIGVAGLVAVLATGVAIKEHTRAEAISSKFDGLARQQSSLETRLRLSEQARSKAESRATEAEKDSGALLAAVQAVRTQPGQPAEKKEPAKASAANDPLATTLDALYPDGLIAILGEKKITVADVRREIQPLLAKIVAETPDRDELMTRLYALQNSVVSDFIGRNMYIKAFYGPLPDQGPRHIDPINVDAEIAQRMKSQFSDDPARFQAFLASSSMSPAEFRKEVEEDIAYAYMRQQKRALDKKGSK